jgi:hypothetical protein
VRRTAGPPKEAHPYVEAHHLPQLPGLCPQHREEQVIMHSPPGGGGGRSCQEPADNHILSTFSVDEIVSESPGMRAADGRKSPKGGS